MADPTLKIGCQIVTNDPDAGLGLQIRLDGHKIFDSDHVAELINFVYTTAGTDAEHCLEFELKHKNSTHTVLDQDNNIVKDACVMLDQFTFDDLDLQQLFLNHAVYTHDFNGTGTLIDDKFFGTMGCNGVVKLHFSTPVYAWLLENM